MSSNRNTLVRSLHDVGVAAWFGGSLAGAVALNGASRDVPDSTGAVRIAGDGWNRWTPVAATAIAAHLVGATGLTVANRKRVMAQKGATANSAVKGGITLLALAVTAYSRKIGAELTDAGSTTPVDGGTVPSQHTPEQVEKLQQQLRGLQWVVPALTGALIVLGAQQGEQQKPAELAKGIARRAGRATRRRVGLKA